ncbi:NAD(P)/FAD-dependent oxidoreductase [Streptomyces sp. NPDC002514]|uniref:NAD(P)/FAD-dependent oxidoreductase n=1 Tax=Streptomyces sp. NPDC001270 TaxID=3364554 RepID=UPI00369E1740
MTRPPARADGRLGPRTGRGSRPLLPRSRTLDRRGLSHVYELIRRRRARGGRACLAGLRAVQIVRRDGYCGRIVLIGREPTLPYDRPPLSKSFLTKPDAEPVFYTDETELAALDAELHLGAEATGLDLASRTVQVDGAPVTYDKLIVATGADLRPLAGTPPLAGVETLRTLQDATRVRDALRHARNVVIVGAGLIGAEVASSVRQLGAKVTIVEAAATPLVRAVGETVGDARSRLHDRHGVRLLRGTSLEKTSGDTHVTAAP